MASSADDEEKDSENYEYDTVDSQCSDMSQRETPSSSLPSLSAMVREIQDAQDSETERERSQSGQHSSMNDAQSRDFESSLNFDNLPSMRRNNKRRRHSHDSTNKSQSDSEDTGRGDENWYDTKSNTKETPRPSTSSREHQNGPKVVIIECLETNLTRISPIKIAQALQVVGTDMVKKVSKVRNGIAVQCFTAIQASRLMKISTLGKWAVKVSYPKSETQCKGVIRGVPIEVSEQEICDSGKSVGVLFARRLKKRVDGKWEDCLSVCLTFDRKYIPSEFCLGYELYVVKPYVDQVVRCFKCQRLGHMALACKGKMRCVRCGGPHKYEECKDNIVMKCCRCGGQHSAAYEGCEKFVEAKRINTVKANNVISYAEATRVVRENTFVKPQQRKDDQSTGTKKVQAQKQTKIHTIQNDSDLTPSVMPTPLHVVQKVDSQAVAHVVEVADAYTQYSICDVACQTESEQSEKKEDDSVQGGQQLVYLISGVLQIFESVKSKKEREHACELLVQKHLRGKLGKSEIVHKRQKNKDTNKHTASGETTTSESQRSRKSLLGSGCVVPETAFSYKSCEYQGEKDQPSKGKR